MICTSLRLYIHMSNTIFGFASSYTYVNYFVLACTLRRKDENNSPKTINRPDEECLNCSPTLLIVKWYYGAMIILLDSLAISPTLCFSRLNVGVLRSRLD